MKKPIIFYLFFITLLASACSKSDTATVDPQIAQLVVGTYKLSSLKKGTSTVSTGSGSAVITAVNNTTASIKLTLSVGNLSQELTSNYQISKSGSDYVVKDNDGVSTLGIISSNVLKMNITLLSFSGTSDTYAAEFTK